MTMKKNILKIFALICATVTFSACDDFFNVDTDNVLDHNDYMDEESEMYSGYIGVLAKLQPIGDKAIYLTDTRGEMLQPTLNAPTELYALYNYADDLTGNSYADPAPYYEVIIACNDYLLKLYEYKEEAKSISINMDHYKSLIAGTLRIKAWTYLTLAKIYGQAIWFDDPLREMKDLAQYPLLNIDTTVEKCKSLLDKGFDGVAGNYAMFKWREWLDPDTATAQSAYRIWDFMGIPYFALYAELCLWSGDYQKAADLLLAAMDDRFSGRVSGTEKGVGSQECEWLRNERDMARWSGQMYTKKTPDYEEVVSVIFYDHSQGQTNQLLTHFGQTYPNKYLLAPSEAGMARFSDPDFNPQGTGTDNRISGTFREQNGNWVINRFRNTEAYQEDVVLYTYRGADLYFMLTEALNNLGRTEEAGVLLNIGVGVYFGAGNGASAWPGFSDWWCTKLPNGNNRGYSDKGIRGLFNLGARPFTDDDTKFNDLSILDEMMLEFCCEGRIYPAMIRMAKRYNDPSIIADRVCPKYEASGMDGEIRSKIIAGGYFVPWDLKR